MIINRLRIILSVTKLFWPSFDQKIPVNEEYYNPLVINTSEDAIDYFKKINYPEEPAFSPDDEFTNTEVLEIGR